MVFLLRRVKHAVVDGFEVYDGYMKMTRRVTFSFRRVLEDTRGLYHALSCKQAPALVGGCPFCHIKGHYCNNTTVYPGAVMHLPAGHDLRARWLRVFYRAPEELKHLARYTHEKMTLSEAISIAKEVSLSLSLSL